MTVTWSTSAVERWKRFSFDKRGQITIMFALSSVMILTAAGGGMDLSRAYMARQKLSHVATLACQFASRPSVVQTSLASYGGSDGGQTYVNRVKDFIVTNLQTQNIIVSQNNGSPFTYTQNGSADVTLSASVPTNFMLLVNIASVPIAATAHCFDTPASVLQRVSKGDSPYIMQEGFEALTGCTYGSGTGNNCNVAYIAPSGSVYSKNSTIPQTNSFPSGSGYAGTNGTQWYIMGYCLETDVAGQIKATVAEGSRSAELDCDDGHSHAGNSSISAKFYLPAGSYEIQYSFVSRIYYPNYDPAYICGSAASDVSWANDSLSSGAGVTNAVRTNQINVYLDLNTTGIPPTHTTLYSNQTLAGYNLIDVCVQSKNWIQRSINVNVTTPGFYWLSFAADGQNDSYGGQIDKINVCNGTCPISVQDNWPAAWSSNPILFEDTFETPYYYSFGALYYANGDVSQSFGTSGASSSGWPNSVSAGWRAAPVNQVNYIFSNPAQGRQGLELDADQNVGGVATSQRYITRRFLLVPGYYQISYLYKSNVTFSSLGSTVYCGQTPTLANIVGLSGAATGNTSYSGGGNATWNKDTNIIGVFMSHDQLASNPNVALLNAKPTYLNPDDSTTSAPSIASNAINLSAYNSAQVNPLLDICGYASSWQVRTANVKIVKPGYYWLTFSSLGTADKAGATIDDVKLTALGSLYTSTPSGGAVTIPVPDPQPGDSITFNGFTIVGDPLTP